MESIEFNDFKNLCFPYYKKIFENLTDEDQIKFAFENIYKRIYTCNPNNIQQGILEFCKSKSVSTQSTLIKIIITYLLCLFSYFIVKQLDNYLANNSSSDNLQLTQTLRFLLIITILLLLFIFPFSIIFNNKILSLSFFILSFLLLTILIVAWFTTK